MCHTMPAGAIAVPVDKVQGRAACVVARLTEAASVCMDTSSQVL
jgi:hypothetical protein